MNKTYNVAVGIPKNLSMQVEMLDAELRWTKHACNEALHDKYGTLAPSSYPTYFKMGFGWQLVEVEADCYGVVKKFVVRRPADALRSLVMVIGLDSPTEAFVKTVWTNLNSDDHASLDKSKFVKL